MTMAFMFCATPSGGAMLFYNEGAATQADLFNMTAINFFDVQGEG